jgi:hypothetical protein
MLQTGSNTTQDTTTSNGRNNVQWSFVQAGRFLSTHNGNTTDGLSLQHRLNDDDDSSFVNIDEGRSNDDNFESLLKKGSSMDSGSTFHLAAGTANIKENSIRRLINPFRYGSNVGSRDITHEGESKIFEGSMEKIDYDAKASVRSLSQMVQEGWTILMDTRLANGFIVEKDGIVRRFMENNGLYMLVLEDEDLNEAWNDQLGRKLVWDQLRIVNALETLNEVQADDRATEYLLDRETKLLNMIKKDLQNGNRAHGSKI